MNSSAMQNDPPAVAFKKIQQKALALGITVEQLSQLHSLQLIKNNKNKTGLCYMCKKYFLTVLSILAALVAVSLAVEWPLTRRRIMEHYYDFRNMDIDKELCFIEVGELVQDLARPPVSCDICEGLVDVNRVSGLSPATFEDKYAYTGTPVVITDAMKNWTAMDHFSFNFFKGIYTEDSPVLLNLESNCQFFPYKTNFHSLGEVFNMSDDRAQLKDGAEPWYIGWSNCDSTAANILRQHYERPYFLPGVSESSKTDWIFMGSPGYGAHLHIDNVGNPSWQAQISGTKIWTLEPPPECYHRCAKEVKVTVTPGDIIVLDTNIWYHSTLITGADMSITIGSEFD